MTENPELQPPPLKDASPVVTQASTSSSTSAVSHAYLNSTVSPSTPGFGLPALWAPSFPLPAGPSGSIATVAPPGLVPSVPMAAPSTVTNAPSSMLHRPGAPLTPVPLNPAVLQHQIYPSYPSLPAMGASPHGFWQQPPSMGGVSRPPFVPYAAPYPGSFSFPARGMAPPSVLTPDSQPPGVSQPGTTVASGNSVTPSSQPLSATGVQTELPPQGIDNRKLNGADTNSEAAVSEQTDLWTAHKTDTGIIYYYNALTGESTYEKPAGFKTEPDKVPVQPTPVSMEQLPGTDWALVTTSDGKKYYYNSKTKISSWQIPSEVTELRKKQESELSKELPVPDIDEVAGKGPTPMNISAPAVNTGGREAVSLRNSAVPCASSALDLIKKKLQDSGVPATSSPPPVSPITAALEFNGSRAVDAKGLQVENSKDKTKDTVGDGNMSDSSSDSEDENGPSKEECIVQFKEMLKERGIAPFSKWEKELPKIVFDPRFKAIPSHSARRSLFEHYVKTRAEEERKEKRAAQKAAIEGFRQLLNEASEDIDHNMDYQTFRSKWGTDPRFEALDRKDREALLNERVLPLKKAAAEKARAVHEAAASSFKGMLQEKGDININSRWSRVKDSLRDDPRYTSVKHEEREVLFNEYISELKATQAEAEREVKTRKEEEDKLKERERELRKRKEREEQEMERVKVKVRRKEAVASFQALLVETIKDPQASWTESKPKLEKDPQQRANNPDLEPSEMEKLFREHTKMLLERCTQGFKVLLAEVITSEAASQEMEGGKTVLNSWSTAKRLLKPDPRYIKMPRKDREDLWHRHADRLLRKQKSGTDQKEDKLGEVKGRRSGETERHASNSRRTHDRG